MASIRRTLSPVPKPGGLSNGEASQVASPLSKSSLNSQNYPQSGLLSSSLGSVDEAVYRAQSFVLGLCSQRSSRPVDRLKIKGQIWRRAYVHFVMCFIVGICIGLTPFAPLNLSTSIMPRHEAFDFELVQSSVKHDKLYFRQKNEMSVVGKVSLKENYTIEPEKVNLELNNTSNLSCNVVSEKLLIIITPTQARPLQAYYLNRLAHTIKLIRHPILWIVAEMNYQSVETAELLRNSGVMYRHLVCSIKNVSEITDRRALLRNVAISHIETHRLDGIVYFADDDRIYSTDLFVQMRNISGMGTWTVAKLVQSKGEIFLEGPICNSLQVVGWHIADMEKRSRRFHAEMSGFAFNSTIIWDTKRWRRPTLEPIRQLETVKHDMQASSFIEQLVEDESQMECFPMNASGIMVWHHTIDTYSYPRNWFTAILSTITPLD